MAVRVGGIALAVVVPFVEGEEEGVAICQPRRHGDVVGVEGEVDETTAVLQQRLFGVALEFVLLFGVTVSLTRPFVFQLHRDDGQAVEEENDVEGGAVVAAAVEQLAGE